MCRLFVEYTELESALEFQKKVHYTEMIAKEIMFIENNPLDEETTPVRNPKKEFLICCAFLVYTRIVWKTLEIYEEICEDGAPWYIAVIIASAIVVDEGARSVKYVDCVINKTFDFLRNAANNYDFEDNPVRAARVLQEGNSLEIQVGSL